MNVTAMRRRALGTKMVRKDFAVKQNASDVNTATVQGQEDIECSYTHCQASLVGSFLGMLGHHGRFDDETNITSSYTKQHKGLVAAFVQDSAHGVEDYPHGNPNTLEAKLVPRAEPEGLIQRRAVVVYQKYASNNWRDEILDRKDILTGRLANKGQT